MDSLRCCRLQRSSAFHKILNPLVDKKYIPPGPIRSILLDNYVFDRDQHHILHPLVLPLSLGLYSKGQDLAPVPPWSLPQPHSIIDVVGGMERLFGYCHAGDSYLHDLEAAGQPETQDHVFLCLCNWRVVRIYTDPMKKKVIFTDDRLCSACVASIIRIPYLIILIDQPDYTYHKIKGVMWANTEIALGITCGCLPILPRFVKHVWPVSSTGDSIMANGRTGAAPISQKSKAATKRDWVELRESTEPGTPQQPLGPFKGQNVPTYREDLVPTHRDDLELGVRD